MYTFDAFVLLISFPSEISILSYSSIYYSYKHSSKKICGYSIAIVGNFSGLFKGKSPSVLSPILAWFFYKTVLPLLSVLISDLIPEQTSSYLSVESRIKHFSSFFSLKCPVAEWIV